MAASSPLVRGTRTRGFARLLWHLCTDWTEEGKRREAGDGGGEMRGGGILRAEAGAWRVMGRGSGRERKQSKGNWFRSPSNGSSDGTRDKEEHTSGRRGGGYWGDGFELRVGQTVGEAGPTSGGRCRLVLEEREGGSLGLAGRMRGLLPPPPPTITSVPGVTAVSSLPHSRVQGPGFSLFPNGSL